MDLHSYKFYSLGAFHDYEKGEEKDSKCGQDFIMSPVGTTKNKFFSSCSCDYINRTIM